MSLVTNAVLTFSLAEDDGDGDATTRITAVNEYFSAPGHRQAGFVLLNARDDAYGGSKRLEHNVAVGAFNYLGLREFCEYLRTRVRWEEPENVRLFVCEQDDSAFREVDWRHQRSERDDSGATQV